MLSGIIPAAHAQAGGERSISRGAVRFVPGSALLHTNPATGMAWQSEGTPFASSTDDAKTALPQALHNKPQEQHNMPQELKQPIDGAKKDEPGNSYKGQLHGSVSLSVMAGFGKGAPKGAGFAQDINLDYTMPLGRHTWLTAGGYMSHLNWSGINATSAGVYGALGYDFDEHWTAYIYGQKSLANSGNNALPGYYGCWGFPYSGSHFLMGRGGYGYGLYNPYADRLGAALRWSPNKSFSIELSVEKDWAPNNSHSSYNRRFDYQK